MRASEPALGLLTLAGVAPGQRVSVQAIRAGYGLARRLEALGLVPGTPLTVVANAGTGPLLVEVRGTRLGLGRGAACKVLVGPAPGD